MVEVLDSRAHWQRTEGMVLFDSLFRDVFPKVLDQVHTQNLASRFFGPDPQQGLLIARAAARHAANIAAYEEHTLLPQSIQKQVTMFTHQGTRFALQEAIKSTVHFPLNLLEAANAERPLSVASLVKNLSDIAQTLQQPFFGSVCETAALTANGVWKGFASSKVSQASIPDSNLFGQQHGILGRGSGNFVFAQTESGVEFDFSSDLKDYLLNELRQRNREARDPDRHHPTDNDQYGTTSGCPVTRRKPQFTNDQYDQSRLRAVANFLGKEPAELAANRSESAIVFGLRRFGELLERIDN